MSTEHTQGRLKAFNLYATPEIRDQDDEFVAALKDDGPRSAANARRLVACWNALIGAPTQLVEISSAKLPDLPYSILLEQRDALLKALKAQMDIQTEGDVDTALQLANDAFALVGRSAS